MFTFSFLKTDNFQMLSPLDENELAAAWRRAAGPDGKVPVIQIYILDLNLLFISSKIRVI